MSGEADREVGRIDARGHSSTPGPDAFAEFGAGLVKTVLDASPEAIYLADDKGKVIYVNQAHERLFGRPLASGRRDTYPQYYAADSAKIMEAEVFPALLEGRSWEGELKARGAAGRHLPVWQRSQPLADAGGAIRLVLCLLSDLSGRRRTEQALDESQARYLAILEDQTELICRSGVDGALTYVNEAYGRYFGKSREELLGRRFLPPLPEDDGRILAEHLASLNHERPMASLEHRVIVPGGEVRWLRWNTRLIFDSQGRFSEYQSVGTDITEQKKSELKLRQSQARYLAILEDQTELICRSAADGTLTFVNEAYCRFFGRTREELLGRSFLPPLPGDDGSVLEDHLASLTPEHPLGAMEHRVITPSGEIRWLRWTTRAIFDALGNFSEYQSVGRDTTERVLAQEALKEAHDTLEQRVRQRTAELQETNAKLARVVAELHLARDELQRLSFQDGLTGVFNRRYFDGQAELEWRRAVREAKPLALIMIDMDQFKSFNDTYGHQAGDECLRVCAAALSGILKRPGDFLARYGGEEFVAVMPNTDSLGAETVAEDMRRAVKALAIAHREGPGGGMVTVSLGVAAQTPKSEFTLQQALADADAALYRAKQAGRNRVEVARPSEP